MRHRRAAIERYGLTAREVEILQQLANGTATAEIATLMGISSNTVRTHVQRIITKLGAHSKLEAVAAARDAGML